MNKETALEKLLELFPWAVALARNSSGNWYLYDSMPEKTNTGWYSDVGREMYLRYPEIELDSKWEDSLTTVKIAPPKGTPVECQGILYWSSGEINDNGKLAVVKYKHNTGVEAFYKFFDNWQVVKLEGGEE